MRWLLRFDDFERVENRISFERSVASALAVVDGETAGRVLDLDSETTKEQLEAAMDGAIIAETQLEGTDSP